MKRTIKITALLLIVLSTFSACDDDDEIKIATGEIAIASSIVNTDGKDGQGYLQLIDDISPASYDNSAAFPIAFFCQPKLIGEDVFIAPHSIDVVKKYTRNNNKELELTGSLTVEESSGPCQICLQSDTKAYLALRKRGVIWIINPETMTQIGEIDITSYGVGDENPDPGVMVVRDNLLYVSLNQVVGGSYPAKDRAASDVLIIDTEIDTVVKMITEDKSGISMPCRKGDNGSMFIDENNDIYLVCVGAFGYVTGHNVGILRINSGETEFDESYSFNLKTTSIEGEDNYMDYIMFCQYADNGILYAMANIPAYQSTPPDYLKDRTTIAVKIDLINKTIKDLGFARSNNYTGIGKYNEYIMFGLATESENGFFTYNTETGEASSEAVIETTGYPLWFGHFGETY